MPSSSELIETRFAAQFASRHVLVLSGSIDPIAYHLAVLDQDIITGRILNRCRELGFALAGVCDAAPTSYESQLMEWLAAGKHGEMDYLRRNVELRIDPRALVPGATSIICVADRYAANDRDEAISHGEGPGAKTDGRVRGRIARYARGDDYHKVMRKRLALLCDELQAMHPSETFRACVDTAPVLEREHAQRAGLGAIGKNTLLLQRGVGSYLLLGEIITTLPLASSPPGEPDPCSSCTRCIDACPTEALTPWSLDAVKCISYLTIEHRGLIDEEHHAGIGDWIFGCDVCQEVCPHNQPTARSRERLQEVRPEYAPRRDGFDLLEVLNWNEESRSAAFIKSSMKRAKLDMMKRNALIAAGNSLKISLDTVLLDRIEQIVEASEESPLVRLTAQQVLEGISGSAGRAATALNSTSG
jgi:epoxyqueuosine reductase